LKLNIALTHPYQSLTRYTGDVFVSRAVAHIKAMPECSHRHPELWMPNAVSACCHAVSGSSTVLGVVPMRVVDG
jgi:hypothetical protein